MRRVSLVLIGSIAAIGGAAACGPSSSVRVRAVDTPARQPAQVRPDAVAVAPEQLPTPPASGVAPLQPSAVAATPTATPAATPTQVAQPETVATAGVAPADAPAGSGLAGGDAAGRPATASDTTAFTSPPTTIVVGHEMPNVVCMDLQAAQNLIQKAGVFYSKSFDATGKNRQQIWDRHWVVVSQNLAPGTAFGEGDAKLGVVKDDDPNNC